MKTISYNLDNLGGIVNMYAIPVQDFVKVAYNLETEEKNVIVSTLDNIITLPCHENRSSYNESESIVEAGKLYTLEINGFVPNNAADIKTVRTLERGRWLVVHKDAMGNVLLSGTQDVPLLFTGVRSTGQNPSSSNGNIFKFFGSSPTPSVKILTIKTV